MDACSWYVGLFSHSRHCERSEDSMGVDSGRSCGRLRLRSDSLWRLPMSLDPHEEPAAIQTHIGAIFISLELSRSKWLITSLVPGGGQRMSKHWVEAGDLAGLLARFWAIRDKVLARTGKSYAIVVIQEAGLDGFWIHRSLVKEGIESHVVDAASIAVSRRRRRAKTDKTDGEALLRALLAFKRGEPRVCSMVRVPTPQDEDRRRICRERKTLTAERIRHVNRIKGLLFSQGIGDYEPLRRDRRRALEAARTGDGRALGANMKAQIGRELDRLELLLGQIAAIEAERDAMLARQVEAEAVQGAEGAPARAEADGPERPGRGNRARGRGGPGRPEADGAERPGRGNRGHALDGGVLPLVRQSPAARRFRRIGGNAVEERLDRSRTGRLDGQSPLAPDDDPIGLVVANPPAELGADALVPRADQGRDQAAEEEDGRRAGAQAARGAVAIRRRRRRDRGRRAEARRPGALRPPRGANVFSRIRRGPINLGRSGWANRWIAGPEKP